MFTKDNNIFLDTNFKTKLELFEFIADKAMELNVIDSKEALIDGFVKREAQSTTGFEDGFAIPHSRVATVKESTVFVFRNTEKFDDYEALDGGGVKYAIALLVPDGAGEEHMAILSSVSMKLLDEEFRNTIKSGDAESVFAGFSPLFNPEEETKEEVSEEVATDVVSDRKLIAGISACPAGVAKTFMAKEKVAISTRKMGIDIEWETQGGGNQKDKLSDEAIKNAEIILITSDIDIELDRFVGKRLYVTTTTDVIKNGEKLIQKALDEAKVYDGKKKKTFGAFKLKVKEVFTSNFNMSWPYLGISATLYAVFALIGYSIYGAEWSISPHELNSALATFQALGMLALLLVTPMLVYSMVLKWTNNGTSAVISLVAMLALVISSSITSFSNNLGGHVEDFQMFWDWNGKITTSNVANVNLFATIFITTITIASTTFIDTIKGKLKANVKTKKHYDKIFSPWVDPLFTTVVVFGIGVFLMGAPLTWLNNESIVYLLTESNNYWWVRFIIGGTIVAFINWDLGGTVNKVTLISLIALGAYDFRFAALIAIGIPIASIGLGLTHKLNKTKFANAEDEKSAGKSFRRGLNGMSEGPLSLTVKYKWRVKLPNLLSSFVAGGLSLMLGLMIFRGGHIGILSAGAQGFLAHTNDIKGLATLLPVGEWYTFLASIAYGIIGYYSVMTAGALTYAIIAKITFSLPGKNKIFK